MPYFISPVYCQIYNKYTIHKFITQVINIKFIINTGIKKVYYYYKINNKKKEVINELYLEL